MTAAERWEERVNKVANEYVAGRPHRGSYDAAGLKQVFIAAAGSAKWSTLVEVVRAVLAGREAGQTLEALEQVERAVDAERAAATPDGPATTGS